MKLIKRFDDHTYDENWKTEKRIACRAIYYKNGKIAMVKSEKHQYYKFPGGGVEKGETKKEALIRETLEETGIVIKKRSIRPFGYTIEKRKSIFGDSIFLQYSYYYFVDIEDECKSPQLIDYEIEEQFHLVFIEPSIAIKENDKLYQVKKHTFLQRENMILNFLKGTDF